MDRREFLALSGMLGAGLVLNPVAIVRAADEDLEVLAKKYIPFMTKPVSVTLNPEETHVREVTPKSYDRMVYGNDGGSLVMFAHQENYEKEVAYRGLASVYRALDEKYHKQVDFFVFYDEKYPHASSTYRASKIALREDVDKFPSIIMYSPFDLLKGETPQKNNGKIKRVDILKGGFSKPEMWKSEYEHLDYWIQININPKHADFGKYWFNNSNKWKERGK